MDDMTPDRWRYTTEYLIQVFGAEDEAAAAIRERSEQAGLPQIAVSSDIGRVLTFLTGLAGRGTAVEVGTLGGYSALYICMGLPPGEQLVTIESDPHAAGIARENLESAGVGDRVRLEEGPALSVLPRLASELGPRSVSFAFLDAAKNEYAQYWAILRPLMSDGGLIVADNILGTSNWWIDQETNSDRKATDEFNRLVASDPGFETVGVFARQGLLIARRHPRDKRKQAAPGLPLGLTAP